MAAAPPRGTWAWTGSIDGLATIGMGFELEGVEPEAILRGSGRVGLSTLSGTFAGSFQTKITTQ